MLLLVLNLVLMFTTVPGAEVSTASYVTDDTGYRLPYSPQYLSLSPNKVRPDQTYIVHVTLLSLPYASLYVRATLTRNGEEYAGSVKTFYQAGAQGIELKVPQNIRPGHHALTLEGVVLSSNNQTSHSMVGYAGQTVFRNTTGLEFDSKWVSIFIQTDRPAYFMKAKVWFRIIGVTKELKPVNGPITIYIKDGKGNIVRRWLQRQLKFGLYEDEIQMKDPSNRGYWTITVEAFGHTYEQTFLVVKWYQRRFAVNLTTPIQVMDSEWGVVGFASAEYTNHKLIDKADATVCLQIRDPATNKLLDGAINKTFPVISKELTFDFTMADIRSLWGDVSGKDLYFTCWIQDWYWLQTLHATSVTKLLKDGIQIVPLGRKFRPFKPNIPFTLYFAVQRTDGSPYQGRFNRQVSTQSIHETIGGATLAGEEQKIILSDDNILEYRAIPSDRDKRITIRVWHPLYPTVSEVVCYRYWSRGNRYISITTSTQFPTVNQYMVFTARTSFFAQELHYMIIASGDVLLTSRLALTYKQKTFSVALSRAMSPKARLVIYCVYEGEVLTDSINFYVRDTQLEQASVSANKGKDFTGDTAELIGTGPPGAFITFNAHDWEFWRRGAPTFLTKEKVIHELLTYDTTNDSPYQHTWWLDSPEWERSVFFTSPTSGVDYMTTVKTAGLVTLSDISLNNTLGNRCNITLGLGRCLNGDCYDTRFKCDGKVDCMEDGFDELDCPFHTPNTQRPHVLDDLFGHERYWDDTMWAWKTTYIRHYGLVEHKVQVPENNNPYVIGAFTLHPEHGLSIAVQPAMFDSTRLFYMVADAPDIIRRGEQVGVRLGLHNNWHQDIEVLVVMEGGSDYRFVVVEEYGRVSSYNPRLKAGDVQTMVSLFVGQSRIIYFPVVPVIPSGQISVTFGAYTSLRNDKEKISMDVVYEGVENKEEFPYLIDLVNKGSLTIQDFDIPTPERFIQPEQRDLLYVPGSNVVTMQVWGGMASPGFFSGRLDLGNTIGIIGGSLDGYVYEFAVNLQVLQYLQITNGLEKSKTDPVLTHMKNLLTNIYGLKRGAGFRSHSKTNNNLWLTSSTLRALLKTHQSEWNEDVYIDVSMLDEIITWVVEQQKQNGSFCEVDPTLQNRDMWPITIDSEGSEHVWYLALTAHVTITLKLAKRVGPEAASLADTAVQKAADYLAASINHITDPYQMAIVAYALNVAAHRSEYDAFSRLKTMKREGEHVYWSSTEIVPNPTKIVNTVHMMLPRPEIPNSGNANTATAYGLMLYLAHNEWEASRPIMKWLNTQLNGVLTWSSTQDTLVVLEALTEYVIRETNRDVFQMEITLESTKPDSDFKHTVYLNKTNFHRLYEFQMTNAWGQVKAYAKGTGYAHLHMTSVHNVEKPWQMDGPDYDTFDFEVTKQMCLGRNCSTLYMEYCVSWIRPDIAPAAGMTYVLVKIPTGYIVSRWTIDMTKTQGIPGFGRTSFKKGYLLIRLEYLTTKPTCIEFVAERRWPVANVSITHDVRVFEYAETGMQYNTLYETYSLFNMHICLVCGSFQCPYCPWYNGATTLSYSYILPVVAFSFLRFCILRSVVL